MIKLMTFDDNIHNIVIYYQLIIFVSKITYKYLIKLTHLF